MAALCFDGSWENGPHYRSNRRAGKAAEAAAISTVSLLFFRVIDFTAPISPES